MKFFKSKLNLRQWLCLHDIIISLNILQKSIITEFERNWIYRQAYQSFKQNKSDTARGYEEHFLKMNDDLKLRQILRTFITLINFLAYVIDQMMLGTKRQESLTI